ncbi:MAG: hypothetical protein Q4G68_02845 [Planctomycetia bacterium]|nr:hypothetical protein [Planctomycetia bacterium]
MKRADPPKSKKAIMLGLGLDNKDGQTRITRGKNFSLIGGSKDTHEFMQETAVKVNETLDQRGKRLDDVSGDEFRDIIQEVADRIGGRPD